LVLAAATSPAGRRIPWFYLCLLAGVALALYLLANANNGSLAQRPASTLKLTDIPVDGQRAFGYLTDLCDIGPRVSGTDGMLRQQKYLKAHFEKLGGKVAFQSFTARHPQDGSRVSLANLIVEWHPERKERLLLCAHYDTRPFPDQDPVNPKGLFVGANDGASGTALLCELAHDMPGLQGKYGVDFVLFDGEELVYDGNRDPYFLGSEHFAREYVANPPSHRYRSGVLLDMVGDAHLQIFREVNSMRTRETRALVNDVWGVARDLGVREFIAITRYEVRDDHLALNDIAKIPTIDVIDFEYPTARGPNYWHTTQDVPENCSALSLAKVGWVTLEWLKRAR
jgi:glutaminyl-peptide cyclotransferase